MAFFDSGTDPDGQSHFQVSPRWWYFLVITVPLTAAVIIFYEWWWRKREKKRGKEDPPLATGEGFETNSAQVYPYGS